MKMQLNLGTTGLRVSRVCLGMMSFGNDSERPWVLDEDAAEPIVRAAVGGGITFFDTADTYSAGRQRGGHRPAAAQVLRPRRGGGRHQGVHADDPGRERRGPVPQAHPLGHRRLAAALDMDYVDLYQIHRWDPRTPIEETMEALHDVVAGGQGPLHRCQQHVRLAVRQGPARGRRNGWTRFVSMQPHYNLIYREEEREMIPQCIDQGVGVIPWSPLARGVLAGNRTRGGEQHTTRSRHRRRSPTTSTASPPTSTSSSGWPRWRPSAACPPAQVALAWLLQRPGVTAPIVGATKLGHLDRRPGRRAARALTRRGRPPGGALRAPPGARPLLSIGFWRAAGSATWGSAAGRRATLDRRKPRSERHFCGQGRGDRPPTLTVDHVRPPMPSKASASHPPVCRAQRH